MHSRATCPPHRSKAASTIPRILATLLCALGFAAVGPEASAAERPNVIVILADDQGSADLGCYGAKDLHTPNLDALAARGVRFTQFYSAAPVCSPSRAGLLTGRWPARAGVPNNCASQPGGKGALPPEEVTLAEMFKSAGYATAHIGKWHIGYTPETAPRAPRASTTASATWAGALTIGRTFFTGAARTSTISGAMAWRSSTTASFSPT